ncbi:hypothetical protein BCV70DRAFT_203085 [Testicularia cyperi]|uniref:Uncharacterized protein n=1 Tax=Testicularia cyperi TaxID=1882483 RepID=A0A317XG86_9BASI|nr:hypothetical protein BCV70DRAFT_203085 [Testicularia cyperi]
MQRHMPYDDLLLVCLTSLDSSICSVARHLQTHLFKVRVAIGAELTPRSKKNKEQAQQVTVYSVLAEPENVAGLWCSTVACIVKGLSAQPCRYLEGIARQSRRRKTLSGRAPA